MEKIKTQISPYIKGGFLMSILQSIKPQYCELIASGKKTIEVRKTRPKCELPVKVYIYCTKDKTPFLLPTYSKGNLTDSDIWQNANGKVIGEYVCKDIERIVHGGTTNQNIELCFYNNERSFAPLIAEFYRKSCLTYAELEKYSKGGDIYAWHISDLVIYDKPKELSEFLKYGFEDAYSSWEDLFTIGVNGCGTVIYPPEPKEDDWRLTHPPQSWCYVEEV